MQQKCEYVNEYPWSDYCYLTHKECENQYIKECDEPYWDYLMKMAKDYVEEEAENQ